MEHKNGTFWVSYVQMPGCLGLCSTIAQIKKNRKVPACDVWASRGLIAQRQFQEVVRRKY